jgi:hypothetical protein
MKTSKADDKRMVLVGKKLKELRVKAGYKSAENFSSDNELNRVQYWRMEKGANFTLHSLLKVIAIHKLSLEEFFKGLK